ncbi:MAG: hypothetical protein Q9218_004052 [Villophora microphyllina]
MFGSKPRSSTLLFLAFSTLSTQLTITIHHYWETDAYIVPISSVYENVQPGDCCTPRPELYTEHFFFNSAVTFNSLLFQQIGAVWSMGDTALGDPPPNCHGAPVLHVPGPDAGREHYTLEWAIDNHPRNLAYAATWIDLRTRFPPSGAESRYLQWQGIKGLVWGKNTWSAASDGVPFPKRKRERGERVNGWAEKGQATIGTPTRARDPTSYIAKNVTYTDAGGGVYRDGEGNVFNLKRILGH